MAYIVGLTGGIGSGKTVVSDHFITLGVPVIDTDVIAREIVKPNQPALNELVVVFGKGIVQDDGSLDRKALREIAFASTDNKAKLDAITHPAIREETRQQIDAVEHPYCIVVVPLLIESEFKKVVQRILVVTANKDDKIERVKERSNLTKKEVLSIMQTQIDDDARLELADDVIENNGTIAETQEKVEQLHQRYLELSTINL